MYKIGSKRVEMDDPDLDSLLEDAYNDKVRPLCMCKGEPGIPMYISHISESDRYLIKRMPSSGGEHEEKCGSWGVPDGVSGRGDILHSGYDIEKGKVRLKFDFPLIKYGERGDEKEDKEDKEEEEEKESPGTAKDGGKKLTLNAFLDLLWEDAGLNRSRPGEVKSDWAFAYKRLMRAADAKIVRQRPLADRLYIPPPPDGGDGGPTSLRKRLIEIAAQSTGSKRSCLIVVAVMIGAPTPTEGGDYRINLGPGYEFSPVMDGKLYDAFRKNYTRDRSLADSLDDGHLIVAALISATAEGATKIEEICAMPVNQGWMPFSNADDLALYQNMDKAGRNYERPLRYNRRHGSAMPAAMLTDTGGNPVLLSVVPSGKDRRAYEAAGPQEFKRWIWDLDESTKMPELPAKAGASQVAAQSVSTKAAAPPDGPSSDANQRF